MPAKNGIRLPKLSHFLAVLMVELALCLNRSELDHLSLPMHLIQASHQYQRARYHKALWNNIQVTLAGPPANYLPFARGCQSEKLDKTNRRHNSSELGRNIASAVTAITPVYYVPTSSHSGPVKISRADRDYVMCFRRNFALIVAAITPTHHLSASGHSNRMISPATHGNCV
jgi:hypothetical protein